MSDIDTKARILDAAEQLFANQGFAATSLRTIIKEADVNTAAVHYHFGSREGLIEAVMQRRADPINNERLKELEELESKFEDGHVPLDRLVEAFVGPPVRLHYDKSSGDSIFPKLMSRAVTEANVDIHDMFKKMFGEVFMRFTSALMRTLPEFSPTEIAWRMHLMIGALAFTIMIPGLHSGHTLHGEDMGGATRFGQPDDVEVMLSRLVGFVSAGMRSPAPSQGAGENR
jgi:AcrR family transcriptional regulator